ncbi:hypothetical protein C0J52_22175 [Blattella germanica]|nr:hypothetical protein C0J52_22175 [Blattella germanica]
MSSFLNSDPFSILKDVILDARNEYPNDDNLQEFLTHLCNSVDSRNVLSASELEEYQTMETTGEIPSKEELEEAYNKLLFKCEGTEDEDINQLIEEIEFADEHISLLTRLQDSTNKEIQHINSGRHQLQQQEKAARYSLLAEEKHCSKLDAKIHSLRVELIEQLQNFVDLSTDYRNKKNPHLIGLVPIEEYKSLCCQFDHYVRILMRQLLYAELLIDCSSLSALQKGKGECIKQLNSKIKNIRFSRNMTLDEIRDQCILLELNVSRKINELKFIVENEMKPTIRDAVEVEFLKIRKCKNEDELCKQKVLHQQLEAFTRCLSFGLQNNDLLVVMLSTERQKLIDTLIIHQEVHNEISDDYSQYVLRMREMQKLKDEYKMMSIEEHPLVRFVEDILNEDKYSILSTDYSNLFSKIRKMNLEIKEQEEKRCALFDMQKISLIQSERLIRNSDRILCSGLASKPLIKNKAISILFNNMEHKIEALQDTLNDISSNFESKKTYFKQNRLQQEQRFLWVYFLMDPKSLMALIDNLHELYENKFKL